MTNRIYKILTHQEWQQFERNKTFVGSEVDQSDGYLHFSSAGQLRKTYQLYFAEQDNLFLLTVRTDKLADGLRWEPSRGGELFPHLYDSIEMDAVVAVVKLDDQSLSQVCDVV